MQKGCPFGTHRVIEPPGVLPQAAEKIDNEMEIFDNEILVKVETLNIDSASFTQIQEQAGEDEKEIEKIMRDIVEKRGKHHNPVTGSGGMFIGSVEEIGTALADRELKQGDRIASLVSLSLTPLRIDKVKAIRRETDQVDIEGKAILFASGIYARLPEDMPQNLALAVLDVAGAPAQTAKLVRPGDRVLIIGAGGKSGLLCLHEAKKRAGISGRVIGLDYTRESMERINELDLADATVQADARDALEIREKVLEANEGQPVDITINCVNIPGTEMGSILPTRQGGTIYFFSMATSFTRAALGAEGVGLDVNMIIGNGYTRDHAVIALHSLRENAKLREMFTRIFA